MQKERKNPPIGIVNTTADSNIIPFYYSGTHNKLSSVYIMLKHTLMYYMMMVITQSIIIIIIIYNDVYTTTYIQLINQPIGIVSINASTKAIADIA